MRKARQPVLYCRQFYAYGCHSMLTEGPAVSAGSDIVALIKWVEDGEAPERLSCLHYDFEEGRVTDYAENLEYTGGALVQYV